MLAAAAAAGPNVGELAIIVGAIAAVLTAFATLVMLGPNRSGKAMEIAKDGINIAEGRARNAEAEEAETKADLILLQARNEALARKIEELRARLKEAGLDGT